MITLPTNPIVCTCERTGKPQSLMPLLLLLFIAVFAQCVAAAEPTYRGKDGGLLFDGLPFIEVLFQRVLYSYVYA